MRKTYDLSLYKNIPSNSCCSIGLSRISSTRAVLYPSLIPRSTT